MYGENEPSALIAFFDEGLLKAKQKCLKRFRLLTTCILFIRNVSYIKPKIVHFILYKFSFDHTPISLDL